MPEINPEKCNGCGICISVCPCNALVLIGSVISFNESHRCTECNKWCAQCEMVCPRGAITCPFEIVVEK